MLALWRNVRDSRRSGAWWGRRGWSIAGLPSSIWIPTRKNSRDGEEGEESVCPMKELMNVQRLLKARFGERWAPIWMG